MGAIAGAAASRLSTHLHFIVEEQGYDRLTTHIFDPDDPYIASDAVFGVKESLLAEFKLTDDPERAGQLGVANPFYDVEFDFTLARANDGGR
jgi:hydroxyquinol 1,2-dioxygenase